MLIVQPCAALCVTPAAATGMLMLAGLLRAGVTTGFLPLGIDAVG